MERNLMIEHLKQHEIINVSRPRKMAWLVIDAFYNIVWNRSSFVKKPCILPWLCEE